MGGFSASHSVHISAAISWKDPLHCVERTEKAETWVQVPQAVSALLSSLGLNFPKCSRRRFGPFHILEQLALEATAAHTLVWPTRAPPAAPQAPRLSDPTQSPGHPQQQMWLLQPGGAGFQVGPPTRRADLSPASSMGACSQVFHLKNK